MEVVDLSSERSPATRQSPLAVFLTWMCATCAQLKALDLSHCANTVVQAAHLCECLQLALSARAAAGLPPLDKITIHGGLSFG